MTRVGNLPLLTALGAILLAASVSHAESRGEEPAVRTERAPLQALILGDWGTGQEGQRQIAAAIAVAHRDSPPDLVLSVGDNFYPKGVEDIRDPLWKTAFEEVYQGPFWQGRVFFPVLGNHDHRGNPAAEIAYSKVSPAWNMPGAYYTFRKGLAPGDSVLFLALDTDPMETGESDVKPQLRWADSILSSNRDAWVVAYGHHPLESGGRHPPNRELRRLLGPLMDHRVSLYLSGHNHSTELLLTDGGFQQAVCGGAAGGDNSYEVHRDLRTLRAFTDGGWCFLRFWPDSLAVELYDQTGSLRYRYVIGKPGSRS